MKAASVAGASTAALDQSPASSSNASAASPSPAITPPTNSNEGFPGYTCISVNDEVVHGIPGRRILKEGDVVTLDLAMSLNGYCDTAITVPIGKISADKQALPTQTP